MSDAHTPHLASLNRHAERVWEVVSPSLPGFTVEVLAEIDSTNTELMRRARAGALAPTLLVALRQSAGRGRRGRSWHSAPGDSLTFSVLLPMAPADWAGLSLVVGVSLAESLHPDLRLKWPNDLWWQQRKLGGILVETANPPGGGGARCAVVGVGLNLATPALPAAPSDGAALPAAQAPAGLLECLPGLVAGGLLERVVPALLRDLQAFESLGFAAFAQRFARRDALNGVLVSLSDGAQGTACGVGDDGALRVLTASGLIEVSSAEVSVRPC